ncbi:hypothetical protein MasN3_36100 [Massilia varians]|uniref:Uncharacterized protein n=1 Tax=Massilia varians TaxID=457921 RepID=A0ABN6TIN0_9BURK|nr:hypothetical protein [Massilia varians]BDT60116.1 hypothetical protein MasN3_36100 [Massilia varians]
MKKNDRRLVLAGVAGIVLWWHFRTPEPTILSFRIGQTFEEVVRNSTYPVMKRSNLPADDPGDGQFGATWVTEPAVIIRFSDPVHGFTLPPTKFAALGFEHNVATTLSTSPMLDKLPFDEAVTILEDLQQQFKDGGWEPYELHQSHWFDLSPDGKRRLHAAMFKPPFFRQETLRVPRKYAMTLRLKCAEGCWTRESPYLFLIDHWRWYRHPRFSTWRPADLGQIPSGEKSAHNSSQHQPSREPHSLIVG